MIFRYPGGKSKKSVRDKIFARFPSEYSEYRDAMVGGGGIFFAVPQTKKRWINDIDPNLIAVYQALKNRPQEFIEKCREIEGPKDGESLTSAKPGGKPLYCARMKGIFDVFCRGSDNVDPALRYFFIHRTVWAGRVNYDLESRLYFSNPSGWNVVFSDRMEKAAACVNDVKVTCGSYLDVLFAEGDDVLVYLDPPYFVNTELNGNSRLYKYNFEKKDHEELCEAVKQCKHKVVISYDNHPYVSNLYKGSQFNHSNTEWTYCGTSSVVSDGQPFEKSVGKELIITNF